jgi:AGZA family xanthine/uracil permease-like MFS transporter
MAKSVQSINWNYVGDAIPAFLTIALMPLSYSISYGLIAGIGSYAAINGPIYLLELISGGRITPSDKDLKEHWNNEGFTVENVLPAWMQIIICKMNGTTYVDPLDKMEEEERLERELAARADAVDAKIEIDAHGAQPVLAPVEH